MRLRDSVLALVVLGLAAAACSGDSSDPEKDKVAAAMQAALVGDIDVLLAAAKELQTAAPAPAGRGWDKDMDAAAIAAMKVAWKKARSSYEHIEGALAPLFPEIDAAIDERYDGFLTDLKGAGDADPFDEKDVTGMHAIERILYADLTPRRVVDFEKSLPGYKAARFPMTEGEAGSFKNKLCSLLVADVQKLHDQWTPQKIDISGAFQGLIGLVNEQAEKVSN